MKLATLNRGGRKSIGAVDTTRMRSPQQGGSG